MEDLIDVFFFLLFIAFVIGALCLMPALSLLVFSMLCMSMLVYCIVLWLDG